MFKITNQLVNINSSQKQFNLSVVKILLSHFNYYFQFESKSDDYLTNTLKIKTKNL